MINKKDYKACLNYIEKYWKKITFFFPEDKGIHIGLPNAFVSSNKDFFKNDQFYWDSYFIILGLIDSDKIELAKGMLANFVYLYEKFGILPSRNRIYNLGISQPPFLTSMMFEIYNATKEKKWLLSKIAKDELMGYWTNKYKPEKHIVYKGLSRYCDHYITHLTSEHESGWDMTSRFRNKCLDILPIDLNCCLYKYETDLAKMYKILRNKSKEKIYKDKSKIRRKTINKLMWDNEKGFFFDYNYKTKKKSNFYSLAGFYPLWAKLATKSQAEKLVKNLKRFEYKGGLANTQSRDLSKEFKQWDYPNGWANQQWIVTKGLLNYEFKDDAERIAKKWLDLNKKVFIKTGKFWEKYNVVTQKVGKSARYPTLSGFGWTNAVFVRMINEFSDNNK